MQSDSYLSIEHLCIVSARGGRTRSNGKWSKEVAIMDNGLIGKWSNWIMF